MLYKQIAEQIKKYIRDETLEAGDKLPSIRNFTSQFNCGKNTVISALNNLEETGLIYAIPKQGYFVAQGAPIKNDLITTFDFLSAEPNPESLNTKNLLSCSQKISHDLHHSLLPYGSQNGSEKLRKLLVTYFQNNQVFTNIEDIVITTGSQQGIDILFNMPFPNKKENILIEQPTYLGALNSAKLSEKDILGISLKNGEIDLNQLEYMFKNNNIKLFYTIPRFHNPLGSSYSIETKKKIVELAHKYDVYILEDDYLGELDLNTKSDPLFSYDTHEKVIYLKSFSKIFLPGLRIGAVCLPKALHATFMSFKFARDISTPIFSQEILASYMENGMFDNHIKEIKPYYAKKMNYALKYCKELLPQGISFTQPETGFYFSIQLPDYISSSDLKTTLKLKNVFVEDVKNMCLSNNQSVEMIRLSIAKISQKDIYQGIQIIANEIKDLTEKKKSVFKDWEFYL